MTDAHEPRIEFPDADATLHEVRKWQRTGELPRRLTHPTPACETIESPFWQCSRLATKLLEALSHE